MLRRRLTFANVVSLLALFIAMGTGGAYAANTIGSDDIIDESIQSQDLKNQEVRAPDIHDGAVTNDRIQTNAVTTGKVQDGTLAAADLASNSVTSAKIFNGSVTNADLGLDSVTGSQVFDASLGAADLGFESVNSGEIATEAAIDSDEILDNSVTFFDLGQGSVRNPEIENAAVTTLKLADNSVTAAKIPNGSVRAVEFDGGRSNGTITLNSGFVSNGHCRDVGVSVPGADPGDAVLFSLNTDVPDGIVISGVRVALPDIVTAKACNLTGGIFPQLNNIQVAVLTIAL